MMPNCFPKRLYQPILPLAGYKELSLLQNFSNPWSYQILIVASLVDGVLICIFLITNELTIFLVSPYVKCLFLSFIWVVFLNQVACVFLIKLQEFCKYSESSSFVGYMQCKYFPSWQVITISTMSFDKHFLLREIYQFFMAFIFFVCLFFALRITFPSRGHKKCFLKF